jgi:hypothetical protein
MCRSEDDGSVQLVDLLTTLVVHFSVIVVFLRRFCCRAFLRLGLLVRANHHAAGWAFCCAREAELLLGWHKDVRYLRVFGENGEVGNDVHGGDVSREDEEPRFCGAVYGNPCV